MDLTFLFSNPIMNACLVSWISAQLIKTALNAFKHKKFDKKRLTGAGGMPSSHSALVCSVFLTAIFEYGYSSPETAIAFVLALIVMYDATGVRWAAGLHARAINNIVEYLDDNGKKQKIDLDSIIPKLDESLGHRVIEVICGATLGVVVSIVLRLITYGAL